MRFLQSVAASLWAAVCIVPLGCQCHADAAPNPTGYLKQDVQRVDDARFRDGCSTLEENPARGDAHGGWHVLREQGNEAGSPKGFCSWLWNIGQFSGGNEYKGKMPPSDCIGGRDKPISADALAAISNTLVNARANGAMLIVRFGYTSGAEEGTEPTDFNVLVGHVRQLAPILGAFPDVVHAVECGMTGPWGEMHSNNYREPHHIRAIGDAWLESLAKETALLVRYPKWVLDYSGKDVDEFMREVEDGTYYKVQPDQRRIGLFNDGYLGTEGDYGTWRNGKMWMNREQGVKYLEARRNVPYGGELAHIKEAEAEAVPLFDLSRYNIVQEFYRTHLSYLRNINGKRHVLAARIGRLVLTHDYDFEGMPDLSEWYGTDLRRFMLTHMGYRFVVRDVKFSTGFVSVDIENTGFGHLLCRCRTELVSGDSVVPVDLDLRKLAPCSRKIYTMPLPGKSAADVPLLLKVCLDTPAAQPILFANDAMREGDALRLR